VHHTTSTVEHTWPMADWRVSDRPGLNLTFNVAGQLNELETAPTAWDVAVRLNALLAPCGVTYCDGWRYDHRWLFLLMQESPETCAFELQDASQLACRLSVQPSALFERDSDPTAHRAGSDAEALLPRALAARARG